VERTGRVRADVFRRAGVVAGIAFLVACGTGERGLEHETTLFERTRGECKPETAPCGRLLLEYPVFSGGDDDEVRDTLNAVVRGMVLQPIFSETGPIDPEAAAAEFLGEYERARAELPDSASTSRWYLERRVAVVHEANEIIGLRFAEDTYTGGAHTLSTVRYGSFDLQDGHRLRLQEVVVTGAVPRLAEIGERAFREVREIPSGQSFSDAGFWFKNDVFTLSDNFTFTHAGLVFRYDPYEVAPYALGPTEFLLAWDDLEGLIRTEILTRRTAPSRTSKR
jgi:hypothetical protein